jgi:DNA-directed RNA polymerase subunit H (RpoH/RPB5)
LSPITKRALTVDHHILSRHTANGILKDAGIGKRF